MVHWHIFIILSKKIVVCEFKLKNLFFKHIKFFYGHVGKFLKDGKIDGNFFESFVYFSCKIKIGLSAKIEEI